MLRSAPEKLCLRRPYHSCSFSTKFAICYCISNSRKKKPQTKHQPDNKKHQAKPYILILKTKPNQTPLLAFAKTTSSADHPHASHSHCISLLGWRQFASRKTHIPFQRPASPGVLSKQTRAIHLGFLAPTPTLCLPVCLLCKVFQLVSTGGKAGGGGKQEEKERHTKVNCTLNSLHKLEH